MTEGYAVQARVGPRSDLEGPPVGLGEVSVSLVSVSLVSVNMRWGWFNSLTLLSVCFTVAPADESSCSASTARLSPECPEALVPEGVANRTRQRPEESSTRIHKRRVKHHMRSRVVRSPQEDLNDDCSPRTQSLSPLHATSDGRPGVEPAWDWRQLLNQLQMSSFTHAQYCPHCRQMILPEQGYLQQSGMYLPPQQMRQVQAYPICKTPFFATPDGPTKSLMSATDEMCPFDYKDVHGELQNKTSNGYIKHKKTPAGLSDKPAEEASSNLAKKEMKQYKVPATKGQIEQTEVRTF